MIVINFSIQDGGAKWCVFVFKTETKNINAACYSMLIIANQSLLNKQNEEKINYLYQSALCVDYMQHPMSSADHHQLSIWAQTQTCWLGWEGWNQLAAIKFTKKENKIK